MAQSKSFFGLRKGSTKSLTFQVLNGKQITKDRVYNVKNPQTIAQMQQRALMATVITAYSTMKEICDHSFEDVEVGAKSMAEFMKINLKDLSKLAPVCNITEYKSSSYVQNSYVISNGTLPVVDVLMNGKNADIDTGFTASESTEVKWSDIAATMGIKKGGMLTIVNVEGTCRWLRIKFIEDMWDTVIKPNQSNITELKALGAIEGNSLEFESMLTFVKNTDDTCKIRVDASDDSYTGAIISEKVNNKWKRSKAMLIGDESKYNYETAFDTYPINTTLLLNGGKMSTNVITD